MYLLHICRPLRLICGPSMRGCHVHRCEGRSSLDRSLHCACFIQTHQQGNKSCLRIIKIRIPNIIISIELDITVRGIRSIADAPMLFLREMFTLCTIQQCGMCITNSWLVRKQLFYLFSVSVGNTSYINSDKRLSGVIEFGRLA